MGKVFESLNGKLREWIAHQKMFFVSTAPLAEDGLINCSPKGLDTFRILDDHTVAYLDLTGSGIETVAHLRENGRIVVMFCAFDGGPKILRLHGRGEVHEHGTPEFDDLFTQHWDPIPGMRSIIVIHVNRIADSCGFAVPLYEYKEDRHVLEDYTVKKGEEGMVEYRSQKNMKSLDGLAGLNNP